MGFQYPAMLTDWLSKEWRRPPQSFVNSSMYYANLAPFFIDYMNTVVRPCIAFANGTSDSVYNSGIKFNIGKTLTDAAARLIKGDEVLFEGDDVVCKAISEIWAPKVRFDQFLSLAVRYMLEGGTAAVKLNVDRNGRIYPTAARADRFYAATDDLGHVLRVTFLNSFLYSERISDGVSNQFWLVEERYYNRAEYPVSVFKVHFKSGVAGQETMPPLNGAGSDEKSLPEEAKKILRSRGIRLNKEVRLPFRDLGVWLWRRTAANSHVPGLSMGDPLLDGVLDVLWAADVAFSGTVTDVILGKGKILVPKRFLTTIREDFQALGIKTEEGACFSDMYSDADETLVYVMTERDKDFPPQAVQFEIRSEQYRGMLEIYMRQAAVLCGFAPTSVFPFLQDGSAKTAFEVNAEDNLTFSTVKDLHKTLVPDINDLLEAVTGFYGFSGKVTVKLSDYIGNKIARDQNIRENYNAGLLPRDIAIQRINGISVSEAAEYAQKIDEERQAQSEYTLDEYVRSLNDNSKPTAEYAGIGDRGSGNEDQAGGEG